MTDQTRRLSAETRERYKKKEAEAFHIYSGTEMLAALHDLDVADRELAAAQAEVAVLDGSWCAENQAEGRNVCGVCKNCLRAKITMLEGVIAAMREALRRFYFHLDTYGFVDQHDGDPAVKSQDACFAAYHEVREKADQLAADHDAVVRADERRKVLSLLADDGFAATFQTTGQYRSALIRALAAQPGEAGE